MMQKLTLKQRCHMAQACLPEGQYRTHLAALHDEMLALIEQQPVTEPVAHLTIRNGWAPDGEKIKYIHLNPKARLPALASGTYGLHLPKDPQPIVFPKPTERKS